MASPDLADSLQALSLDPECLPFCPEDRPTESKASLREKLEVPRYLFRVYTPNSAGVTDKLWTKSMDARYGHAGCKMDILKRTDDKQVAGMLNRHLRWMEGPSDNLVSWTSSILFALTYIFHLHANERDGSAFEDICLCIVDTSCFPKGVFLRDMDLIDAYRNFDQDLKDFASLRSKKHSSFSGFYYFGEYLSQGALKIANKCEIVAAQKMIAAGLYDLQPKFQEFARRTRGPRPPWANLVIELREGFYQKTTGGPERNGEELKKAVAIAKLFGPHWSLPVAANLIAMLPHQVEERDILEALKLLPLTGSCLLPILSVTFSWLTGADDERRDCFPSVTRLIACDDLPEVKRFGDIMRSVYPKAVESNTSNGEKARSLQRNTDGVQNA